MICLLEEILEIAENYDEDEKNDECYELLAGACQMGIVTIVDGKKEAQGINVFLSPENTGGEPPAFVQVGVDKSGNVILDEGMPKNYAKDMLEDQVEQARARAEFCENVLELLKPKKGKKSAPKKPKKRKYTNAV